MNGLRIFLIASSFLLGLFAASASAEDSWSLPSLNLFGPKQTVAHKTSSPLRLPKLDLHLPEFGNRTSKGPTKPSMWDKVTQGTKDFFDKTKDILTPGSKKKGDIGWKYDSFQTGGPKKQKESFFSKLLPGKEKPPRRPRTPAEFLALPRPE